MTSELVRRVGIRITIIASALAARVDAQRAEVISPANAKGIVVLCARFSNSEELHSFGLEISLDGQTFADAQVGALRGLRLAGTMVDGSNVGSETVLMVPVVGRFGLGAEGFLFPDEGTYFLRWDIAFKAREVAGLKLAQSVQVDPASKADLDLLAQIGDRRWQSRLLGFEPPEAASKDLLALGVIAALLEYPEHSTGGWGTGDGKLQWGSPLMEVARQFAESSYAPYLAFYAAGVYLEHLAQTPEAKRRLPATKDHDLYHKADEALLFTVERADPFLKPRALCSLAYLRRCGGSWDEAEKYLARAEEQGGGQSNVLRVVHEMRRDILRLKAHAQGDQP